MIIIPIVFNMKLMTANLNWLIFVIPASMITPASSGRGEAIKNPANIAIKYFLIFLPTPFSPKYFFILFKDPSLDTSLNSSSNENFIKLNIIKSDVRAPMPAMIPVSQMFEGFNVMKNPTAKGAENPNAKSIPAMKTLM